MSFIVEDGTGVANSNSYEAIAGFESYWTDRGVDYSATTTATKQAWLIKATQYLDINMNWRGSKTDIDNSLEWPRINIPNVDSDEMPVKLKSATSELAAVFNSQSDIYGATAGVKSKKIGKVSISYNPAKTDSALKPSIALLQPYLKSQFSRGSE